MANWKCTEFMAHRAEGCAAKPASLLASLIKFSAPARRVHFQLAMLAYNLNCWLMLFNREEQAKTEDLRHTTLATARLRFLFLAAKIVRHAGAVLVRYSDHYAEQGTMTRLMDRLRLIVLNGNRFAPVLASALRL